ncbi:MAG TPA: flagellar biosynthetic protein FliO [Bryobacteraceae bacterium]|nr:flagellar biosynthetic protein FliO [Bryobacteraceae bacterium]
MEWLQQVAAIGAVLALVGGAWWWLGRRGFVRMPPARRAAGRRLECLERLALAPQHTLHLVRMGDMALLVASTPAGCRLVRSLPLSQIETSREAAR